MSSAVPSVTATLVALRGVPLATAQGQYEAAAVDYGEQLLRLRTAHQRGAGRADIEQLREAVERTGAVLDAAMRAVHAARYGEAERQLYRPAPA